jgi:pimeloyl-ACP methyl ester carboxylesterase
LIAQDIDINGRLVPLETDLSTPLAYLLSDPLFQRTNIGTRGLFNPNQSQSVQGLYMLEPFDPGKIPVLMVHGFWSSLITWMEMFNDLRGSPEIRNNFQFWFYLYPTGQPFWITAAQLRQDLHHARTVLDPHRSLPALDQMVLVGHSMGGLIAKLQTIDSGNNYWNLASDRPFEELRAPPETLGQLRATLFFGPNPSIQRVVTIATPHRGSEFANGTTQWLAKQLIRLPETFVDTTQRLVADNEALLANSPLLKIRTSVDSLAPDSPILPLLLHSTPAPWVEQHNIVGRLASDGVLGKVTGDGDGVVKFSSAHMEDVASELVVPADHINIHRHPRTVLEVQRILLDHLAEVRANPVRRLPSTTGQMSARRR